MYAIRKDNKGFRVVLSEKDIDPETEIFSEDLLEEDTSVDLKEAERLLQKKLDAFAQEKGYASIEVAVTYANSIVEEYSVEGLKAKNLRDESWAALYRAFSGKRKPFKTFKEIEKLLPEMSWG